MTATNLIQKAGLNEPATHVATQDVADKVQAAEQKRVAKLKREYGQLLGKAVRDSLTEKQAGRVAELAHALGSSVNHFRGQIEQIKAAIAAREVVIDFHTGGDAEKLHELTEQRRAKFHELRTSRQRLERELALIDHEKDAYRRKYENAKRAEHMLRELRGADGWGETCKHTDLQELLDDPETLKHAKPEPIE